MSPTRAHRTVLGRTPRLLSNLALLALLLIACNTSPSVRLEPRFDPNIDYGQIEAGSFLRLEVEVVPAGMLPPEVVIEWSVDTPDVGAAPTSSLRAIPGEPNAIEYRPPVDTRGPVVVRAELPNEDCGAEARATEACSAEFPLRVVAPGPPTLRVFIGGNEVGEFLLEWTAPGTDAIRWQYRHRPEWELVNDRKLLVPWGDWMDVPHSDGDTRTHRATGLPLRGVSRFFLFQVRPWTATGAGTAYEPVQALASERVAKGIVRAPNRQLLEGGRRFAIGACSFVVPHGMHVDIPTTTHIGPQYGGGAPGVTLRDTKSRASILVNVRACELFLPHGDSYSVPDPTVPGRPRPRNVDALFKQIVESFEKVLVP